MSASSGGIGREDFGPIHGYGCAACQVWFPRGGTVHPLTRATDHARNSHDGDRECVVIVRDEASVASWEVSL